MQKLYFLALFGWLLPAWVAAQGLPARLEGQWHGPLAVPGGSLELAVTIVPLSNGTYYAALDVPQQHIARMPVDVALKDNNIALDVPQAGSHFTGKVLASGDRLEGTWQQPGLKVPLVLERSTAPEASQAARKMRLTPPYRESVVTFYNVAAKIRLAGTLTVPAGPGPFPAVVLLSDSGPQTRDADIDDYPLFGILADYLTRHGLAVLRYDDRGAGKSGGDFQKASTLDFVSDAQAALSYLRGNSLVEPLQVGLLGHGEGANVALLAAADADTDEQPAFVVALAGYGQPGRDVLRRQQGEILRLIGADGGQVRAAQALFDREVETVRQTANNATARARLVQLLRSSNTALDEATAQARAAQLTSSWSRFFLDFDPATKLPQVHCPVLLLGGNADLQVSAARNLPVLQKGLHQAGVPVEAHRLPGVNHYFQGDPAEWPIVAGERQASFSQQGLDYLRLWLQAHTHQTSTTAPVTVARPATPPPAKAAPTAKAKAASKAASKVKTASAAKHRGGS